MQIQIDGGSSNNKGAQLMMVAVLQEVKRHFPDAKLIINNNNPDGVLIRETFGKNFRLVRKASFYRFVSKFRLERIAKLFSNNLADYLTTKRAVKGANIVFNIGGFQFGDQWNHNKDDIRSWERYLKKMHQYGAKYVFLPQAFGPFDKSGSKEILDVVYKNSDVLIARDDISFKYVSERGDDGKKIFLYPDFTASVIGKKTSFSENNKSKVCIIPNSKIIQKGILDKDAYISAIVDLANHINKRGFGIVLLNHEGRGDFLLCNSIASRLKQPALVITGLNAIETKGVIAASYLVISSRFHGVANSLSSCVPCLATSWSHKYQKLLEEYAQNNCLLDLSKKDLSIAMVDKMLDEGENSNIRKVLERKNKEVIDKNCEMWDVIWNRVSQSK